jgi:1-deoxy-D-xylulose-5-phosphate reductoisomerase
MTESITILGSTGSIGTQTLDVCRHLGVGISALTAGSNLNLLEKQIREFHPEMVSVVDAEKAGELTARLFDYKHEIKIFHGKEGNINAACWPSADTVVAAMVGVAGLEPVIAAIKAGKNVALANKETLVAGGALVMPLLAERNSRLLPVDSEHSAIWQCLAGSDGNKLKRILLTASGGPFRGRSKNELENITVEQALNHPTWKMGGKISIDSATLMNKGLEVIEASWLFDCPADKIEVVVHPQSIIHSMVEYADGSVLAQMGFPDMKLPIQLALTWPCRVPSDQPAFDPFDSRAATLTFERPDQSVFRLLPLAYEAARIGGTMPAVLNAANEAAVEMFLNRRISFLAIAGIVEAVMEVHQAKGLIMNFNLEQMLEADQWARDFAKSIHRRH